MSLSDIIFQLNLTAQNLNVILGLTILIGGICGNLLNIIIFITLGNYRHNACSLFMLAQSIFDINVLVIGLGTRIVSQGFQIDFTLTNRIWCKLRACFVDINVLCSLTCLCLQSVDVFLCTSQSVIWRQKMNGRMARHLLVGSVFIWIIHQLPYFFLQELIIFNGSPSCSTINIIYSQYRTYFLNLGLYLILPITIISLFASLTYRRLQMLNIHQRRSLSVLSRQTIHMALVQIIIVLLFMAPYGIATVYFVSTADLKKDTLRFSQEKVAQLFFLLYAYGTYSVSHGICIIANYSQFFFVFRVHSIAIMQLLKDFVDKLL